MRLDSHTFKCLMHTCSLCKIARNIKNKALYFILCAKMIISKNDKLVTSIFGCLALLGTLTYLVKWVVVGRTYVLYMYCA